MNKKTILASLAVVSVLGVSGVASKAVSAEEMGQHRGEMAQKIAERFGLDETEVETFFEEQGQLRMQERQAQQEERLNSAVEEGILTEEQKNLLLEKREENRPEKGEMQDLTEEERQALREQHQSEMQTWAEENGIDLTTLHEYLGGDGPKGPRGGRMGSQNAL